MASASTIKRPRGRPRAADAPARLDHILSVAEAMIVRDGYQGASVDAIARAAGISKKTIYSQFTNKAGLLAAVVDRLAKSLSAGLEAGEDDEPRDGLLRRALIILDASYDATTVRFDIVMFRESQLFPELGAAFQRAADERYIKPVEAYLRALIRRGAVRQVDPDFAARAFVFLLTADIIVQTAMGAPGAMTPAQRRAHAERVCDLFLRGLER